MTSQNKEFNLSEKIQVFNMDNNIYFLEKDVKEFIKRLNEKAKSLNDKYYIGSMSPFHELVREINILAGDKLNGK